MNMKHISPYSFDDLLGYVHDRLGFRFTASKCSKPPSLAMEGHAIYRRRADQVYR